jgi:arylsulfatase A-like enzyme
MMKRYALYVILALSCLLPVKQTIADKKQNMFESRLKNAGKTNIVFILADDMSYYDMSGLGQKHFDTPNLDELMHEGLFFHQAYSGSPECAPSRGSLLTGMHMGHCRIRCNRSFRGQDHLEAEDVTIAEVLKQAGYATGMFGKWGVGIPGTPGTPDKQGFDYSIGYYDQLRAHGFFPNYLMENGEVIPLPGNYGYDMRNSYSHSRSPVGLHTYNENGKIVPKGVKDPAKAIYSQQMIQEKALEFIHKHKDEPFFVYYATQLPHGPVIAPDISKFMDKPWDMKHKEWAAMVELLDTHVGQMVELLEELGLRENTLILFASDNGYAHWGYNGRERYLDDPIFDNKGPWDRGKFIATDGGSRIPFFANWPKVIQPGTESDVLVALYDILPTACEIAGVKPPDTDGKSFLPVLSGDFPPDEQLHDYLYWENGSHNRDMQSARFRNWFAYREGFRERVKVFDLSRDITCSVDLAESRPDIVQEALSIFEEAHVPSLWYSNPEDTEEERVAKEEGAKDQWIKATRPNSRKPKTMQELKKMLDAQETIVNTYPDE